MKNIISLLVLICSVAVIIVSCAKKDEESTTTAAATVPAGGSGSTASGTVSGIDDLTGTFHMSYQGQEPSGGCINNSTAVATMVSATAMPSGTLSFKKQMIELEYM